MYNLNMKNFYILILLSVSIKNISSYAQFVENVFNDNLSNASNYYMNNDDFYIDRNGKLDMSKSGITDLNVLNNVADPLAVRSIDLSYNKIQYLNSHVFGRFTNLEQLYLDHNLLEDFYKYGYQDIFEGLNCLRSLDLSHNKISYLPENLFSCLNNLRKLYLSYNKLTELPTYSGFFSENTSIFFGLNKLEKLTLSNNYLEKFPKNSFLGLKKLKSLYLNNNNLIEFPVDFFGYSSVFSGLNDLQILDISGNALYTLPTNGFKGLNNLVKLYLNKNSLRQLPTDFLGGTKVFSRLYNLKILDLSDNKLDSLPKDGFKDLGYLTDLYLQRNRLGSIPTGFWSGTSLFNGIGSLRILNLSHNNLNYLPYNIFERLKDLRRLYLNNNILTEITTGFWGNKTVFDNLHKLETLDISNNKINYIPATLLDRFPNMKKMYLDIR